jgi:hypothetical protein
MLAKSILIARQTSTVTPETSVIVEHLLLAEAL